MKRLHSISIGVAMGLFSAILAQPVLAECPDGKSLQTGFVLELRDWRSTVRPVDGPFLQVSLEPGRGKPQMDLVYEGLFPLIRSSERATQVMLWDDLPRQGLDLKPGSELSFTHIPVVNGKPLPKITTSIKVLRKDKVRIGDCTLDTLVIDQEEKQSGVKVSRKFKVQYSPLLRFVVSRRYEDGLIRSYEKLRALK